MDSLIRAAIGAFLISSSFGVLYGLKARSIVVVAGLVGVAGNVVYQVLANMEFSEATASFGGAIAFTLVAWIAARLTWRPVVTYTAPGLIPLVPGGDVYKMMVCFLRDDLTGGWTWGLQALAVAGMLTLAMLLVSAVPYTFSRLREKGHDLRRRF